jgi:hypothetical protein
MEPVHIRAGESYVRQHGTVRNFQDSNSLTVTLSWNHDAASSSLWQPE